STAGSGGALLPGSCSDTVRWAPAENATASAPLQTKSARPDFMGRLQLAGFRRGRGLAEIVVVDAQHPILHLQFLIPLLAVQDRVAAGEVGGDPLQVALFRGRIPMIAGGGKPAGLELPEFAGLGVGGD